MAIRRKRAASKRGDKLPPLPLDQKSWQAIAEELELSPQQTQIVELILRGRQDKEIAEELGVSFHTVRTYLKRIFDRTDAADRVGLVLHIFALAQNGAASGSRHK